MTQDQLITGGMGGAIAINQMAIHAAMELFEVQDRRSCFEKVVMVSRAILKQSHEEREAEKKG